uniref:Uncharacterized protein n=1 Tax=Kalanchoe fedtschenkoi TaxID=63787 RepID=A0A7N0T912_KALFE
MADIAMLVAEEHERRIKHSRRRLGDDDEEEKLSFASRVSIMKRVEEKIGEDKVEGMNWVLEPRSDFSLAASNGFFSA